MKSSLRFIVLLVSTIAIGCKSDQDFSNIVPKVDVPVRGLQFKYPSTWPIPVYNPLNNGYTDDKFVLGRRLFYEEKLSRDNTISCGSCHQQEVAFAHSGHDLSHGIDGLFGTRNALPLFNLAWNPNFMWDGGINHIEVLPLAPITNPLEMDSNIPEVISKLSTEVYYRDLFKKAFGDEGISTDRIFKSLAYFMTMAISYESKYDLVIEGKASFTPEELDGYNLFKQKCNSCHTEPLFTDYTFRNNGLTFNQALNDTGRAHITALISDLNKFRVPSLRNIEITAPYMHDGRFTNLEQVLQHYNSGIQNTLNLDPLLANKIALSNEEKNKIISFLKTLTDKKFTSNLNFKDPN